MPRTIVMGDPTYFSVRGGANPHTRTLLGLKKRVDPELACRQWHSMARALIAHGTEVLVIEPEPRLSGLVYPANAGFLYPLAEPGERSVSDRHRAFYLSNLLPTRAGERPVYQRFISTVGLETRDIGARFEGEADFFPAGRYMIFTYGRIERQRFVPRLGIPPWKRIYGFRSDVAALRELERIVSDRPILPLELCLEAHYHGDTVLCSFGPQREFLLAYMEGLTMESKARLSDAFGNNLIALSATDAAFYAANSFQTDFEGKLYVFLPEGVSAKLMKAVRARGTEPITVNVSEFLAKGGGSVKCMILDLGPSAELPRDPGSVAFRSARNYQRLFGSC
jgi:N-dimethylarginine dimethylaminohydrolase